MTPEAPARDDGPTRYRYDPADPTPAIGGPVLLTRAPVVDQAPLEGRPDVVAFTGEPLEEPLTVIGPVHAVVYVRSSLPHHDVFVRLCDVDPQGVSRNVCDALVRVEPGAVEEGPDGVRRVRVDLWPTAHRFGPGHCPRVLVASGAHPRYARNTGTGEPVAQARRLAAADIEVFHDPPRPSRIVLSVVEDPGR
jgi:putative CocE/NonD family hydrolase